MPGGILCHRMVFVSDKQLLLAMQSEGEEGLSGAHPPHHDASLVRLFLRLPEPRLSLHQLRRVAAGCTVPDDVFRLVVGLM